MYINDNIFLTTWNKGTITQWKYDSDDIQKEYEKEKVEKGAIFNSLMFIYIF